MRRLLPLLLLLSLFTLSAWTLDDCLEVNFDHPDCDRYVTTTTPQQVTTTTQPEVTTTTFTEQTTTTTIRETPTTQPPFETTVPPTTTTVQECVPPLIHQPPFCVPPTTDTTAEVRVSSTEVTRRAELPHTGPPSDVALLLLAVMSLGFLGFVALKWGKE